MPSSSQGLKCGPLAIIGIAEGTGAFPCRSVSLDDSMSGCIVSSWGHLAGRPTPPLIESLVLGIITAWVSRRLRTCRIVAITSEEHVFIRLISDAIFSMLRIEALLGQLKLLTGQLLLFLLTQLLLVILNHPHPIVNRFLECLRLPLPFGSNDACSARQRRCDGSFGRSVWLGFSVTYRLHICDSWYILHRLLQLSAEAQVFPLALVFVPHRFFHTETFPVRLSLLASRALLLSLDGLPVSVCSSRARHIYDILLIFHSEDFPSAHAVANHFVGTCPCYGSGRPLQLTLVLVRIVELVVGRYHAPALRCLSKQPLLGRCQVPCGVWLRWVGTRVIDDSCFDLARSDTLSSTATCVKRKIRSLFNAVISRFACILRLAV